MQGLSQASVSFNIVETATIQRDDEEPCAHLAGGSPQKQWPQVPSVAKERTGPASRVLSCWQQQSWKIAGLAPRDSTTVVAGSCHHQDL